ncbi:MAG: ornithine cyclodeaminase family protein [Betaproteobacteria bacterium]|nr:ornithine cyclodeaminase family protein [Betaproteobacteria bacterium]
MRIVDAAQTELSLPFAKLIPALCDAFVTGCVVPPRHHHAIDLAPGPQATLLLMPAWKPHDALGVKIVNVFPGNSSAGLPGLYSVYLLFDADHGTPIALLDGNVITSRRTAAVSALAASYLARPDAERLLVVGAGRVASLLPEAYREVRAIRRVAVWDVAPAAARLLVERLATLGFDAAPAPDLEAAVRDADIVTCATLATEPLVSGAWLRPGTHLDLIGSFTPGTREADDEAIRRSTIFIDTKTALEESGELLRPMKSGAFSPDRLAGTLADLCAGRHPGRTRVQELTLFKAVGTALADLTAAMLVRRQLVQTSA